MPRSHYCARCLNTFTDDPPSCPNLSCGKGRPKSGWGNLLGPGDLLDRHYHIVKVLAVGGAGLTYLAREIDADGSPLEPDLAIKVLYTQRDAGPFLRRLSNEAQIIQELDHDNIVKARGFVHRTGHAPYLVTLFEHGGSLSSHVERVGPLPARVAAGILRQVLLALDVAHQRGIVHRDLKPDNVLLHEAVDRDRVPLVRLTDFGIAKVFGGFGEKLTRFGAFVGTPEYAAPEQFEGMAPTPATDLFAAGGLLWYLLVGRPPVSFKHRMDIATSHDELLGQIPPRLPPEIGEASEIAVLQEILDHTMRPEPGDRWTAHQVIARLGPLVDGSRPHIKTLDITDQGAPERDHAPWAPLDDGKGTLDALRGPRELLDEPQKPVERPGTLHAPNITFMAAPDEGEDPPSSTVASPPPPAPPASPASSKPVKRGRGGLLAAMGGAVVVIGGGGAVLLVATLLGTGWAMGWFGPAGGAPAPEPPPEPPPRVELLDLEATEDPKRVEVRKRLEASLDARAASVGKRCRVSGPISLGLVVDPSGGVQAAKARSSKLDDRKLECVEQAVRAKPLEHGLEQPVRFGHVLRID